MVDSGYVEMIGRNLGYFERILVDDKQKSYDILDDNQDGFYKSIRVAASIPSLSARAASLFINSYTFIEQRGNYKKWARAAVRIANRFEDDNLYLRCRVVSLLGLLQYESGDLAKAKSSFIASERLALECEDDAAVANAWYYRAVLEYHTHQPEESIQLLTKTQQIIDTIERPLPLDLERLSGFILNLLGIIKFNRNEHDSALEHLDQARKIFAPLNLQQFVVMVDLNVSQIYRKLGNLDKVLNILEGVIAACKDRGLFFSEVKATLEMADAQGKLNNWLASLELINQIDQIKLMKMGYRQLLARTKVDLGTYLAATGKSKEAELHAKEGISILKETESGLNLAIATGRLAEIYRDTYQPELAKKKFQEGIEIAKRCGNDSRVMQLIDEFEAGLKNGNMPV